MRLRSGMPIQDLSLIDSLRKAFGWPVENDPADEKPESALELLYSFGGPFAETQPGDIAEDASSFQRVGCVLVEAGATWDNQDAARGSLLDVIVRLHHHTVLKCYLRLHTQALGTSGMLLHWADATDTETLIEHGADIKAVEKNTGVNAAFGADAAKLKVLFSHGAQIDYISPEGETPLMDACWRGDESAIDFLLKHGAAAGARSKIGNTPLLNSARGCRLEMIERLLTLGGSVRSRAETGESMIMMAVSNPDERVIPWLIDQGVDVNIYDFQRRTALIVAKRALKDAMRGSMGGLPQLANPPSHYQTVIRILQRHGGV